MNKIFPVIMVISFATLLQGCITAPFSNDNTARSNGKNNLDINAGYSISTEVIYARAGYGIMDNFDLGIISEVGIGNNILGAWSKYTFVNKDEGASLALLIGAGAGRSKNSSYSNGEKIEHDTTIGYYGYIGPIFSYKYKSIEPYLIARFNHLHLDNGMNFEHVKWSNNISENINYGTLTAGTNIWITNNFGFSLDANSLVNRKNSFSQIFINLGINSRF